ncbi:MAG: c-type cytochrome [Verrucomicrobia bacterium]|jgi:putative heme-binding domain-containing protein|nr:c-type cytochrome [Verrucomicrobiota bacterium]MDA7624578.1 c-type cytochrome [bacterium]MBT4624286.1 c-type cytochrome [Verrucomicrobiota bacterium]MBT4902512.1 c-type cytochrome [Verrucomicrobiota bacterium]MBT5311583.1 c-type cytochrome [Verrucomicrobiota bacterium]
MKRVLFFLLAFALSLPNPLRAQDAEALSALVGVLKEVDDPAFHLDILKGISAALKGQRNIKMPKGWKEIAPKLAKSSNAEVQQLVQTLSLTFGSKAALDALRKVLVDGKANLADRQKALAALLAARDRALPEVLRGLLREKALRRDALRGLGAFEDLKTSSSILRIYAKLDAAGKRDALTTLASRVSFAKALMAAVTRGTVKANELPADIVRQLRAHRVKGINATLDKVWGVSRSTPAAKLAEIAKYKKLLETKVDRPDNLPRGRSVFQRTCAQCHKLYGEGGEIGPDITGSNRNNLDYLITNILDPNAEIPNDYRTTILRTKDNRVLVGVIHRSGGQSVTIATPAEVVTVAKRDVAAIDPQNFSMMPEGLVLALKEDELRDLVAYLRGSRQVALPEKPGKGE